MTSNEIPKPTSRGGAPKGNSNAISHGAPHGNKNALKHGLYSRWFTRDERRRLDLDPLGRLIDEENSLIVMIDRIFASMSATPMDFDRTIAAGRAVALAAGRIESIHRSRKALYENITLMEQAMEELKYIPPDQD